MISRPNNSETPKVDRMRETIALNVRPCIELLDRNARWGRRESCEGTRKGNEAPVVGSRKGSDGYG